MPRREEDDKNKPQAKKDERSNIIFSILSKFVFIFTFYLSGAVVYHKLEGWDSLSSLYFTTVTLFTVGYGDIVPTKDASRIFTIFFIVVSFVFVVNNIINGFQWFLEYAGKKASLSAQLHEKMHLTHLAYYRFEGFINCIIIISVLFFGTLFMAEACGWTYVDALYWTVQTATTVGFGDIALDDTERIFAIFYIFFCAALLTAAITNLGMSSISIRNEKRREALLERHLNFDWIRDLDPSGEGLSEAEFLATIICRLHNLDMEKDVLVWMERFDELDEDQNGQLTLKNLVKFAHNEEQRHLTSLETMQSFHKSRRMSVSQIIPHIFNKMTRRDARVHSYETTRRKGRTAAELEAVLTNTELVRNANFQEADEGKITSF